MSPARRRAQLDCPIRNYECPSRVPFAGALYQAGSPERYNYCNRSRGKGGFKRSPLARMKYASVLENTDFRLLISVENNDEERRGLLPVFLATPCPRRYFRLVRALAVASPLTKRLPEFWNKRCNRRKGKRCGRWREKTASLGTLISRSSRRRGRYAARDCAVGTNNFFESLA